VIELLLQAEGALSVGLLDRAETLYRQVANADPRNAIAIVGLSRVALERGQQPAALELARRALEIDHENVAAQRMVQRLEEVLAFQGVDVTRTADVPSPAMTRPARDEADAPATPGHTVPAQPAQAGPDVSDPSDRRSLVDRLLRRR
jgi:hypothetical protein